MDKDVTRRASSPLCYNKTSVFSSIHLPPPPPPLWAPIWLPSHGKRSHAAPFPPKHVQYQSYQRERHTANLLERVQSDHGTEPTCEVTTVEGNEKGFIWAYGHDVGIIHFSLLFIYFIVSLTRTMHVPVVPDVCGCRNKPLIADMAFKWDHYFFSFPPWNKILFKVDKKNILI